MDFFAIIAITPALNVRIQLLQIALNVKELDIYMKKHVLQYALIIYIRVI